MRCLVRSLAHFYFASLAFSLLVCRSWFHIFGYHSFTCDMCFATISLIFGFSFPYVALNTKEITAKCSVTAAFLESNRSDNC